MFDEDGDDDVRLRQRHARTTRSLPRSSGVGDSGDLPVWDTFEQAVDAADDDANNDLYSRDLSAGVTKNESAAFTTNDVTIDRVARPRTGSSPTARRPRTATPTPSTTCSSFVTRSQRASRSATATEDAFFGGTNDDGTHVAWTTAEPVAGTGDTDNATDVYETLARRRHARQRRPRGRRRPPASVPTPPTAAASCSRPRGNFGPDQDGADDLFVRAAGTTTALTPGTGTSFIAFNAAAADGAGVVYTTLDKRPPAGRGRRGRRLQEPRRRHDASSRSTCSRRRRPSRPGRPGRPRFNPPPFGYTADEAERRRSAAATTPRRSAPAGRSTSCRRGRTRSRCAPPMPAGNVGPGGVAQLRVDSTAPTVTDQAGAAPDLQRHLQRHRGVPEEHARAAARARSSSRARKKIKVGKKRRVVTFASKSFSLKPGKRTTLRLRVSKGNLALLRRLGKVRVVMTATVRDGLGNKRTTRVTVTLKAPKSNR